MEMRRKDKEMEQNAMERVLYDTDYGVLATAGEDGSPYGVPMNYVYEKGKVYFHGTKAQGHRNQNLSYRNRVCFTVVCNNEVLADSFNTRFESVILTGIMKEVTEGREEVLKKFLEKYSGAYMEKGMKYIASAIDKVMVYEMTVEDMTGKAKY